jgi:hypothetical protein
MYYNPRSHYLPNQPKCLFQKLCIIKGLRETGFFVTFSMTNDSIMNVGQSRNRHKANTGEEVGNFSRFVEQEL